MTKHSGAHPRMGATDVCPFVPVSGLTMDDCVELARRLGQRVGDELGFPVYLYEYAATEPKRKNLAYCRQGEYEGLKAREGKPEWKPDFGPFKFPPRYGATAVSARDFLIAWNINLNTRDAKLASKVANRLRERGFAQMSKPGVYDRDENGSVIMIPGRFQSVKAVGWYIEEYYRAQVSVNITNHHLAPIHEIFDAGCELAQEFGLRATGSELVGLIPLDAMLDAGRHYLQKQGSCSGVSEADLVQTAIQSMGLSEIVPFNPIEKVIEYRLRKPGILTSKTVTAFVDELASTSPAPGGGSVAALVGALGTALAAMVGNSTYNKKGYTQYNDEMNETAVRAQELKARLVNIVDRDTEAFNRLMAAFGLPKKTDEEIEARAKALQDTTRAAALVPFEVVQMMPEAAKLAKSAVEHGNVNMASDAGISALAAFMAARGAAYNVMINLQGLPQDDFAKNLRSEIDRILKEVDETVAPVRAHVEGKLWG